MGYLPYVRCTFYRLPTSVMTPFSGNSVNARPMAQGTAYPAEQTSERPIRSQPIRQLTPRSSLFSSQMPDELQDFLDDRSDIVPYTTAKAASYDYRVDGLDWKFIDEAGKTLEHKFFSFTDTARKILVVTSDTQKPVIVKYVTGTGSKDLYTDYDHTEWYSICLGKDEWEEKPSIRKVWGRPILEVLSGDEYRIRAGGMAAMTPLGIQAKSHDRPRPRAGRRAGISSSHLSDGDYSTMPPKGNPKRRPFMLGQSPKRKSKKIKTAIDPHLQGVDSPDIGNDRDEDAKDRSDLLRGNGRRSRESKRGDTETAQHIQAGTIVDNATANDNQASAVCNEQAIQEASAFYENVEEDVPRQIKPMIFRFVDKSGSNFRERPLEKCDTVQKLFAHAQCGHVIGKSEGGGRLLIVRVDGVFDTFMVAEDDEIDFADMLEMVRSRDCRGSEYVVEVRA